MSSQVQAMQTVNVSLIKTANAQTVQIPATNQPMIKSPKAVRFYTRNKLFKAAMVCLVLCTILFIIGFSAPAWLMEEGLWMTCYGGDCHLLAKKQSVLVQAVGAMECLALIAFVVCLTVEFRQDFRKVDPFPEENKAVEILAFLAGIFGLIGVILFRVNSDFVVEYGTFLGFDQYVHVRFHLIWGFGLIAGACSLTIVCAACIAYSRVKQAAQTNAHWPLKATPSHNRIRLSTLALELGEHLLQRTPILIPLGTTTWPGSRTRQ